MVHCYGGRSRSAALIAAFLMSSCGCSYQSALQRIQAVRSVAHINKGFEIQLKAYAHANYDVYIAQQVLLQGRVRALQSYRAIDGNSADDLIVKATERKKFGSMHPVGSNGSTSRRRQHSSGSNPPGSKRSWGCAKDDDESMSSSSEDAEEEDNLMECAVKIHPGNHASDVKEHHNNHTRVSSSLITPRHTSCDGGFSAHYLAAQDTLTPVADSSHHTNAFRLRQQIPLMDPRSPRLRLSRPGSTSVRVIPPLRGLERVFCCAWCLSQLFNLASVIRTDIHVLPLPETEANVWGQHKSELDTYTSHSVLTFSPRDAKQDHQEKESSYLMPAPSPRASNLAIDRTSYPADTKSSLSLSANRSFSSNTNTSGNRGNGYKSPPKTMRSKAAKSFDFDSPSENPRGPPKTNLFLVSEDSQSKLLHHEAGHDRVTSPMEIIDSQLHENKLEKFSPHSEEKPPLCEPRRHSHLNISEYDESHSINLSRPGSGYRSRAPSGLSSHSSTAHHTANESLESPRITFPHGSRDSFAYPSPRNRPQSAEKRRWLARVTLLKSGIHHDTEDSTSDTLSYLRHDEKVAKLSRDDDEAIKLGFGREKYIHLEYLEWMGEEILSPSVDSGELKCNHCHSIIGSWTWRPTTG